MSVEGGDARAARRSRGSHDKAVLQLRDMFLRQEQASARMGAPMYADLCKRSAADVLAGGPVLRVAAAHLDALPKLTPLRLLGGLHRVVLSGRAPELAAYYPNVGGTATDPNGRWSAFLATCDRHRDELSKTLDHPPQTNEVGRAAVLVGGLAVALAATGRRPVRLLELGASAGLNLRADRFCVEDRGPPDSPVHLEHVWRGNVVPAVDIDVVERRGCDLAPVDPTTPEGQLWLTSYVWPDDLARHERLRAAFAVAAAVPAVVDRASVLDWLRDITPAGGALTVLWHSAVRLYLTTHERAEWDRRVAAIGIQARAESPVAHLSLEPADDVRAYAVRLTTWPGGMDRTLGTAGAHGIPVLWTLDAS
ncbi:MAG: DUF2332 domain-containing protein [Candidatus Nanopelagicales bacterium]